ncbi:hypothetical protein PRZ48_008784 [Zasmidium cellare]|uniref:F-box domain-containing protein n=1 Tax=Zasmidium cellare TaxID=395010 RepID=A0ABR0EHH1_ZASCE|nr:hypothetical protein PRZ48_008784 [Zasmidium cellare]
MASNREKPNACNKTFKITELLESLLLEVPDGQTRRIHSYRGKSASITDNITGSLLLRRKLWLEPEAYTGEHWLLNDLTRQITLLVPLNPTRGNGTLSINDNVFFMRDDRADLDCFVVRPPIQSASIVCDGASAPVFNITGIKVGDVRDAMKAADPDGRESWKLWINGAVFAPESIIDHVRKHGYLQVERGLGEVLDDSTRHILALAHPYGVASVREGIFQHLRPHDLLNLRQVSKSVQAAMDCDAATDGLFLTSSQDEQFWVIDMQNTNEPVCSRLSSGASIEEDVEKLYLALGREDPTRERFAIKAVSVVNDAVFALPESSIAQQAADCEVELIFKPSTSTLHEDSTFQDMLLTSPPIEQADVIGDGFEIPLRKDRPLRGRDVLVGPLQPKSVRVYNRVLVKQDTWDRMQTNVMEISREEVYGRWKDHMAYLAWLDDQ